jgi:hypothetical protein
MGILCAAGVVLGASGAQAAEAAKPAKGHEDKVVPAADTAWQPLDPKAPDGPQVSVVWGEFNKAPVGFFLRVKAGTQFPRHSHTYDYDAVVVQGEWKHTFASETDAVALPAGSHWHQSGKKVHGDGCVSASGECIVLVSYPRGKRDFILAPEPKK